MSKLSTRWFSPFVAAAALVVQAGPASASNDLSVSNETRAPIKAIYMSPLDIGQWSKDLLKPNGAAAGLAPGATLRLTTVTPGLYDFKLEDAQGRACVIGEVDFNFQPMWSITPATVAHCPDFGG